MFTFSLKIRANKETEGPGKLAFQCGTITTWALFFSSSLFLSTWWWKRKWNLNFSSFNPIKYFSTHIVCFLLSLSSTRYRMGAKNLNFMLLCNLNRVWSNVNSSLERGEKGNEHFLFINFCKDSGLRFISNLYKVYIPCKFLPYRRHF